LGPKTPYALLSFLIQNFQFYRVVHFLVENYYVKKQNVNLFVCFFDWFKSKEEKEIKTTYFVSTRSNESVHEELGLI